MSPTSPTQLLLIREVIIMEDLEKEVALLREKLELMEKIKELEKPQIVFVPQPYPVYIYPVVQPYLVYPPSLPVYIPWTEISPVSIPWGTTTISFDNTDMTYLQ